MTAVLSMAYALIVYASVFATFLYAIGFVGNAVVPKSIDVGASGPIVQSIVVDVLLLGVFAVQHSVMARRSFKAWWTRIVPPHVERSTYVLAATLALALLMWQWRPIAEPVVWHIDHPMAVIAIRAVFALGWGLLLLSSFLIDHFELFGLRQPFARLAGRPLPAPQFRTPLVYRYVRHPIYLGFLLGIWFEERDLVEQFGERYRRYRARVGMLLPMRRTS